jgi:hypothetical protein
MTDRFHTAARAYLIYGVVYWVGGVYLAWHGVGVRGTAASAGMAWIVLGLILVVGVPYLLRRPRAWFERWVLSRRDFARVVAAFMTLRALAVLRVVARPETAMVSAPWGGEVTFRSGALVFLVVTVVTLFFVARAAWQREPA